MITVIIITVIVINIIIIIITAKVRGEPPAPPAGRRGGAHRWNRNPRPHPRNTPTTTPTSNNTIIIIKQYNNNNSNTKFSLSRRTRPPAQVGVAVAGNLTLVSAAIVAEDEHN